MVIQDPFYLQTTKKEASSREHRLAQPLDRLAAFVIDGLIILTPLIVLFLSPFKRQMVESLLLHEDSHFSILLFAMIMIGVTLVIAYQTIFIAWRGATVGKLLLGLRVVDVWSGNKPSRLSAFIRAICWLLDCVLLFVPHLETLTNRIRRPLHDRIAETVVVTDRSSPATSPGVMESAFIRGVISAFVAFICTAFVAQVFMILSEIRNEHAANTNECQLEVAEDESRLRAALKDFAAGLIESECLALEATREMQERQPNMDLVYLAQSFAQSGDADVSNRYLEQVCETKANGTACLMSKVIEAWSDENWKKVDQQLKFSSLPNEPYIEVWALRHYLKQERFTDALSVIDRLRDEKSLSSFLLLQKVKSLWGMEQHDQARELASIVLDTQDTSVKHQVSQFICYEELMGSCESKTSSSCHWVGKYYEENDFDQEDSKDVLTFLKWSSCENGEEHLAKWEPHLQNENIRALVQAVAQLNDNPASAREQLWELMKEPGVSDLVKREAAHSWVASAKTIAELELLNKDFLTGSKNLSWARNGRELFAAYFQMGHYQQAMDVGIKLSESSWSNESLLKKMTIAAYQLGRRQDAYAILQSLETKSERQPASADEFSVIRRNLEQQFGRL